MCRPPRIPAVHLGPGKGPRADGTTELACYFSRLCPAVRFWGAPELDTWPVDLIWSIGTTNAQSMKRIHDHALKQKEL
jgi:hypothetical protein